MNIKTPLALTIIFLQLCCFADKKQLVEHANLLLGTDIFPYPEYSGNNSLDPDFGLYANEIVGPRTPDGIVSPSPLTSFRGAAFHARGAG